MKSTSLMGITLAALLAVAIITPLAAQQTTDEEFTIAVAEAPSNDHREGKPKNGGFAVSAVTIVDGAYATNQIGTLPKNGGPYNFLTNLSNGAFDPTFTPDDTTIFFWGPVENGPDGIYTDLAEVLLQRARWRDL
jgi:hypothetical protein